MQAILFYKDKYWNDIKHRNKFIKDNDIKPIK